jgi:hypothetical protein
VQSRTGGATSGNPRASAARAQRRPHRPICRHASGDDPGRAPQPPARHSPPPSRTTCNIALQHRPYGSRIAKPLRAPPVPAAFRAIARVVSISPLHSDSGMVAFHEDVQHRLNMSSASASRVARSAWRTASSGSPCARARAQASRASPVPDPAANDRLPAMDATIVVRQDIFEVLARHPLPPR